MFSQHRSPLFRSNSRVSKIPAACNRAAAACASFARFHSLETFHLERTPPEMHNFVSQPLFPAQWFALSPLCSNSDRNVTRVAIGKKKKKNRKSNLTEYCVWIFSCFTWTVSATIGVTVHREESKSGPSRKSRRSAKAVRPDADEREVVLSHRFLPFQRTLSRFEKENSCVDFLFDLDRYFSTVVSRDISKGIIRMFFRRIISFLLFSFF